MTSKLTVGEFLSIVRKFHAETAALTNFSRDAHGRYETCTVRFRSDNGHHLEVHDVPFTYRGPANTTPEYARAYGNWYELLGALRMLPSPQSVLVHVARGPRHTVNDRDSPHASRGI